MFIVFFDMNVNTHMCLEGNYFTCSMPKCFFDNGTPSANIIYIYIYDV